ncbi:hypothetical protein GCM10023067_24240 [Aminobacter aganoensis]
MRLASNLSSDRLGTLKRMLLEDRGYVAPDIVTKRLFDSVLDTNTGLVVLPGGELESSASHIASYYVDTRQPNLAQQVRKAAQTEIKERAIHVFHRSCGAYGHFLLDGLCALALSRQMVRSEGLKIIVPKFLPRRVQEVLVELGFPPEQLIVTEGKVLVRDMSLSNMLTGVNSFKPRQDIISCLREFTDAKRNATPSRRIYLTREGAYSPRTARNEVEVVSEFQAHGFELVSPAYLSFREQIDLFSQAKVIAGNHGSAFANMVFSPPCAQIIDLMPEHWVGYWGDTGYAERWLLNLTAACDHNYTVILSPSEMSGGPCLPNAPSELAAIKSTTDLDAVRSVLTTL